MNESLFQSKQYQCKRCGAPLSLKVMSSVFAVCQYCSTAHVRNDMGVEDVGTSAELVKDFSALQLGTKGSYQFPSGKEYRFELIGRIKVAWERGAWDEWYIIFENNTYGWLAEAQGFYYISFYVEYFELEKINDLALGQSIQYERESYRVNDFREASVIYSSGELPFKAIIGETYKSIDCVARDGRFMNISIQEDGEKLVFLGTVHIFPELKFEFLNKLAGWSA